MNIESIEKSINIGKIKKNILYKKISGTPTMYRSYPNISAIYVRGLYYGEVAEIAKLNSEYSLEEAVDIYRDAIYFEGDDNFKIEDLELADFVILSSVSNILTTENFAWHTNFNCTGFKDNPEIQQIKNDIEEIKSKLQIIEDVIPELTDKDLEKALEDKKKNYEELDELEKKLKNFDGPEKVPCNFLIQAPITIEDLAFEIEDENVEVPLYILLEGNEIKLEPLKVKDYIFIDDELDNLIDQFNVNEEVIFLALHIKNEEFSLEDKINIIKYSSPSEIENLKESIERFNVNIKDVEVKCPICGKKYIIEIELQKLKVYPQF